MQDTRWWRDREEYHFYHLCFVCYLLVNASTNIDNRMHSKRRDVLRKLGRSLLGFFMKKSMLIIPKWRHDTEFVFHLGLGRQLSATIFPSGARGQGPGPRLTHHQPRIQPAPSEDACSSRSRLLLMLRAHTKATRKSLSRTAVSTV